jgi:hypothetical protein
MNQSPSRIARRVSCIFMLVSCGAVCATANAAGDATPKDEARWSQEDVTPQARYRTLQKEAAAAYRENTSQCKSLAGAERASCLNEAKSNYQKELADAKSRAAR